MGIANVRYEDGDLFINGEEVRPAEVQIKIVPGTVPEVWVRQQADPLSIEGPGVVKVIPTDDRESFQEVLSHIDPETLENDILAALEPGVTTGQAAITVLRRYVS